MRALTVVLASVLFFVPVALSDEGHHHALSDEEIGSVHFATSCRSDVGESFNHAVALLHSFQYEQARQAFTDISREDPQCAMAQWGIAMSHYHGLWDNGDMAAGRIAINQAKQIGAANANTTSRESAYIDALADVYREDGKDGASHGQAFEQKMGALQAAYPQDDEAAIFHALTLAITAPKTDKTFANQKKCGEILEPIFARQPHHPGVAHYIIHCYDNPVLAAKGLGAARMYAKIAPASAHANHMPSHLFTRVGSWDESISSNLTSEELAASGEPTSTNGEARDQRLHAMDYLEYAYLQSGRVNKAKAVWDEMQSLKPVPGLTLTGDYGLAAIPARYTIELGNWERPADSRCARMASYGHRQLPGPQSESAAPALRISNVLLKPNRNLPRCEMPSATKTTPTGPTRSRCSVAKSRRGWRSRTVSPATRCEWPAERRNSKRAWIKMQSPPGR